MITNNLITLITQDNNQMLIDYTGPMMRLGKNQKTNFLQKSK